MAQSDEQLPTEEELAMLEPTNATRRLIKATDNSVTEDGLLLQY